MAATQYEEPDASRLSEALTYWRRAQPVIPQSVAAEYLRRRGCIAPSRERSPWWPAPDIFADSALRWFPREEHPSGWRGPCLVALVTDTTTGRPLTVHRTWLAPDGSSKAPLDRPRLLWPGLPKRGGVVRLVPDDEITVGLAIAEGIETALAFAQVFPTVWACIDAGNLASFPVLDGVESLTICADHDKSGLLAAENCARRWYAARREVRVFVPQCAGRDFADVTAEIVK